MKYNASGYPETAIRQILVREFDDFDFPPTRVGGNGKAAWIKVQAGSSETLDKLYDRFAGSIRQGSELFIPIS